MQGLDFQQGEPLAGLQALDVGCGGGILSESLARMGAQVHGIDITKENVQAASHHARLDPLVQSRTRSGLCVCLYVVCV
jgi:2-polyprenyl-3-methyl-5-hydroxy-6-metoxy-1,4-benzoquinol methylase